MMDNNVALALLEEVTLMRKATERIAESLERGGKKDRDELDDVDELDTPEDLDKFKERLEGNAKKHEEKTKGRRVHE